MNERWQEDRNDDISKLFRENEGQLEERPSFRAWDRLERKLDSRRMNKRKVSYRYTSMVAASIAILAMIFTIRFLDDFSLKMDGVAQNEAIETLEEAPSLKTEQDNIKKESDYKQNINNQNSENLFVSTDSINSEPIASTLPKAPIKDFRFKEDLPRIDDRTNRPSPIASNTPSSTKSSAANRVEVNDTKVKAEVEKEDKRVEEYPDYETIADEEIAIAEDATYIEAEEIRSDVPVLNSSGNPVKGSRAKKEARKTLPGYSSKDKSTPQSATDNPVYTLSSFDWMTGDWKDVSIEGSYDQWTKVKNGFEGNGYVIIGSDTSFVETMRIYKRGSEIYFAGSVDGTQKVRKFKLDNYKNNVATFTRNSKSFPNQVVISHISDSSYMIVYENKEASKVNTKEELYNNYRNRMSSRRASRNMTRH